MRINLKCCCGATFEAEARDSAFNDCSLQQQAAKWHERHANCRPAPIYAPNPPADPGYVPTGPAYIPPAFCPTPVPPGSPPWEVTCGPGAPARG